MKKKKQKLILNTNNMIHAIVTLDNDQIKSLPSSYIDIVPAPGVGKGLLLIAAIAVLDNTAGAYTNVSSDKRLLLNQPGGLSSATQTGSPFFDDNYEPSVASFVGSNSKTSADEFVSGGIAGYKSDFENKPITLSAVNGMGNFTGGHADNTCKVTVYYVVVDL